MDINEKYLLKRITIEKQNKKSDETIFLHDRIADYYPRW